VCAAARGAAPFQDVCAGKRQRVACTRADGARVRRASAMRGARRTRCSTHLLRQTAGSADDAQGALRRAAAARRCARATRRRGWSFGGSGWGASGVVATSLRPNSVRIGCCQMHACAVPERPRRATGVRRQRVLSAPPPRRLTMSRVDDVSSAAPQRCCSPARACRLQQRRCVTRQVCVCVLHASARRVLRQLPEGSLHGHAPPLLGPAPPCAAALRAALQAALCAGQCCSWCALQQYTTVW
jgi:hypothetical protein